MDRDEDDGNGHDNPGLPVRVGKLEVAMAKTQTDINWIKLLVTPTFIVSVVSLLILIASLLR